MNSVSKNKKMQMEILDVPKITNTARSHEETRKKVVAPTEVRRKLSRTAGLDKKLIKTVMFYIVIITSVALLRSFVGYDVASLGKKIQKEENKLKELKKDVARLDNEFINSDNLKIQEQKAKEQGFSFPSGHSLAVTIMVGTLIVILSQRIKNTVWRKIVQILLSLYIVSVLVSRIYLGVHYPSDVIASLCVGLGVLFMEFPFYDKLRFQWRFKGKQK